MRLLSKFRASLARLLRLGSPPTGDIDDELLFHLEERVAANIAAGMSPNQAAREARRSFGTILGVREKCREAVTCGLLETTLQDVRFGLRLLLKSPGFIIVAAATLALGIGANTAIFSVINSVLLQPLAYRDPERLVVVSQSSSKRGYSQVLVTPAVMRLWQEQSSDFEELGGEIYESLNLTGVEKPEHLHAALVTTNFFSIFGVAPILGRTFTPEDKSAGGGMIAVLSYGLWQRAFAGDPAIIGKTVSLSGIGHCIVGVMPPDFKIFNPPGVFGLPTGAVQPQLWVLHRGSMSEAGAHFFLGFGRLKPEINPSRAQASLNAISARLSTEFPALKDWGASVRLLQEQIVDGARPSLMLLLVAVGLVLLIACANVANLSLARSTARRSEFALRAALGASRSRLVRQSLVESAILALIGGTLGVLLARGVLAALVAVRPSDLPRLDEIQLNATVLAFSFLVSVETAVVVGLAPALRASNPDLNASLRESGPGCGEAPSRRRAGDFLMVTEVALAMMLLAGAGLLINSFARLGAVQPGFQPEQLLTFDFSPPEVPYADENKRMSLHHEILDRIRALPGVESSATVYGLPFGTMLNATCGVALDNPSTSDNQQAKVHCAWRVVSPGCFETLRVPILAGRSFSEKLDSATSLPVAIINESFARKHFPGQNPLGRTIQIFSFETNWHKTIVGVIHDVKLTGLDAPVAPEVYQPTSQQTPWMFSLVVRSSLPPRQIENLVRSQIAAVDKDLAPFNIRTMESAIRSSVGGPRFTATLIGLFASLALALTVVGIYGVISYSVSLRTREIGIRIALGATRGSVIRLVVRRGLILALAGAALGLCGSFALTRFIASQLFEVSPHDPLTFAAVVAFLMLVALSACYLPSRRAARVDPITALHAE